MKLIVLYGPPGVGKLTVAKELAAKTGYRVFHNHLLIELLCTFFAWGSPPYDRLVRKYRFELLEAAAKHRVSGVIMTFVYAAEVDDAEMRELLRRMRRARVKMYFVQLLCDQRELERRIRNPSRKQFTKVRHAKNLRSLMKKYDLRARMPFDNGLSVDTTRLSARRTAFRIIRQFRLR